MNQDSQSFRFTVKVPKTTEIIQICRGNTWENDNFEVLGYDYSYLGLQIIVRSLTDDKFYKEYTHNIQSWRPISLA
jgi:hypothetical protein